jgi:hypothetical protein
VETGKGQNKPIKVLDHITVGENRYFGFADAGLIEQYNSDFLSLKEGKTSLVKVSTAKLVNY